MLRLSIVLLPIFAAAIWALFIGLDVNKRAGLK